MEMKHKKERDHWITGRGEEKRWTESDQTKAHSPPNKKPLCSFKLILHPTFSSLELLHRSWTSKLSHRKDLYLPDRTTNRMQRHGGRTKNFGRNPGYGGAFHIGIVRDTVPLRREARWGFLHLSFVHKMLKFTETNFFEYVKEEKQL